MARNRGKDFETIAKEAFLKVPGVSIDRIPDQTMHHKGACNICDFIVYKKPYEYYIECKTTHGNTLPFTNITDTQWKGLLLKSQIEGVTAGILCWWVDKDITKFIPIGILDWYSCNGKKSIRYDTPDGIIIPARKKRVFFEYDMEVLFNEI